MIFNATQHGNRTARPAAALNQNILFCQKRRGPDMPGLVRVAVTTDQTPTGLAFSTSIFHSFAARATSFACILPSCASAAIAACAM